MKPIVKLLLVSGIVVGGIVAVKKFSKKQQVIGNNTANPNANKQTSKPKTVVTYSTGLIKK